MVIAFKMSKYSKFSVQCEHIVHRISHDSPLLVLSNFLLKEVCLALQGDQVHEVKWVLRVVVL